jgi:hypothetical protein
MIDEVREYPCAHLLIMVEIARNIRHDLRRIDVSLQAG